MRDRFILTIIIFFFAILFSWGQQNENTALNDCIKQNVNNFFIKIDRIEKDRLNNLTTVHIIEILDKQVLGYNKYGIYLCTTFQSNSERYLLLKFDNEIKILNSNNPAKIIQEISAFLIKIDVSESKSIEYLQASINIVNENRKKIVDKVIEEEEWISCM